MVWYLCVIYFGAAPSRGEAVDLQSVNKTKFWRFACLLLIFEVCLAKMQSLAAKRIYFCGSIRAGRQDVDLYSRIIGKLEQYGDVLTPFVGDKSITIMGSEHEGGDKGIHDRDVAMLEQSTGLHFSFVTSINFR